MKNATRCRTTAVASAQLTPDLYKRARGFLAQLAQPRDNFLMSNFFDWLDGRRVGPRVGVGTLCSEHNGVRERHGLVTNLSASGLRITRPYDVSARPREVTLEFEVPEVDEIVWARGEICFDRVTAASGVAGGSFGLVRTTGVRIVRAAARDMRLLRDVAYELWRMRARAEQATDTLALASCYARG